MAMENPEQEKNQTPKSEETNSIFFEVGVMLLIALLTVVAYAYVLIFAWNDFMVSMFKLPEMTFTNAVSLLVLKFIILTPTYNAQTSLKKNNKN